MVTDSQRASDYLKGSPRRQGIAGYSLDGTHREQIRTTTENALDNIHLDRIEQWMAGAISGNVVDFIGCISRVCQGQTHGKLQTGRGLLHVQVPLGPVSTYFEVRFRSSRFSVLQIFENENAGAF